MAHAPPPNSAQRLFDQFEHLFTGVHVSERVVPLVLERMYRGVVAEKRSVALRRRVRCACGRPAGCRACAFVGWTVENETLDIVVPAGIQLGTRLRLGGKGDEALPTGPQDLLVEIVEEGPRADELRAAHAAHEAASDEHHRKRRIARAVARTRGMRAGIIVAAGLLVAAVAIVMHAVAAPIP